MRDSALVEERNKIIVTRFQELCRNKIGKIQLYAYPAMLEMLSQEFYLKPLYIEKILKNEVRQKGKPHSRIPESIARIT